MHQGEFLEVLSGYIWSALASPLASMHMKIKYEILKKTQICAGGTGVFSFVKFRSFHKRNST